MKLIIISSAQIRQLRDGWCRYLCVLAISASLIGNTRAELGQEYDYPRYLSGDRPSYLVYADDGEGHLEFSLSVKYPFNEPTSSKVVYFTYTGDYDFYLFTRDSAPVVSRRQNPGLFFQHNLKDVDAYGVQYYRIGWYHESNGQSIETVEEYNAVDNPQDFVSRGWDYLGMELKNRIPVSSGDLYIQTQVNVYCDCQGFGFIGKREDDIFWEPVTEQPSVTDFNGLKLTFSYVPPSRNRYTVSVRTGTHTFDSLSNVSVTLGAVIRVGGVPLKLFYFNGYGINLSTYHEKGSYFGIGFDFW